MGNTSLPGYIDRNGNQMRRCQIKIERQGAKCAVVSTESRGIKLTHLGWNDGKVRIILAIAL